MHFLLGFKTIRYQLLSCSFGLRKNILVEAFLHQRCLSSGVRQRSPGVKIGVLLCQDRIHILLKGFSSLSMQCRLCEMMKRQNWEDIKDQGTSFCVMGFAGRKGLYDTPFAEVGVWFASTGKDRHIMGSNVLEVSASS